MIRIGIDIGSTAAKSAVFDGDELVYTAAMPTGFNGVEAAGRLAEICDFFMFEHPLQPNGE